MKTLAVKTEIVEVTMADISTTRLANILKKNNPSQGEK